MSFIFHDFDPEDLWGYSYEDTIKFLEDYDHYLIHRLLKDPNPITTETINGIQGCYPIIHHRNNSIDDDTRLTKESGDVISSTEKMLLDIRLSAVYWNCISISQKNILASLQNDYVEKKTELEESISAVRQDVADRNQEVTSSLENMRKNVSESEKILENATSLLEEIQRVVDEANKTQDDSRTLLKRTKGKLDNIEHDMLTHVLTLMGVFSAVITIVMSVIITSTAWLNNADGASAILAFIIPTIVAVFAVTSLLFIVFLYHIATTGFGNHSFRSLCASLILFAFLVTIAISTKTLVGLAKDYTQKCAPDHTHTILTQSDYTVVNETKPDGSIVDVYFEFTFNGENYRFKHNEAYLHDGKLYFCHEHKCLE